MSLIREGRPNLPKFVFNSLFWAIQNWLFLQKVIFCVLQVPKGGVGWGGGGGVTDLGLSPKTKLYFDAFPKRQMCIDKYFCIKILKLAEGILPNPAAFTFDEGRKLTNHNQPQPAILGFWKKSVLNIP